ncbi:hypothetical protein KKB83_01690 [Patescibacteria group bacterium]|nr:hypothetical protein [Patescibacteria group bacterium]
MSAAKYQGSVRSLVKKLKYKPYAIKAYEEIDLILRRYFTEPEQLFPNNAILIPIPLHPKKLQKRGFNQAEFVAQTLSSIWKLPIQKDLLQRTRQGVDQTSLSRKERIKNVHGLYRINPQTEESLRGKRFILVDDVTTTGATLKKCARLLKQNGANKVWGATFARD